MYSPPKILLPLLWPLSLMYGALVVARAWLYKRGILKQKRLNGVVISVGNLTVGGTGKTPMVMWLAEHLKSDTTRQAILIRGYRGTPEFSDEANLLRTRIDAEVEVGVGPDRWQTGRALESKGYQRFILDDGFQHLQLVRDVDIVLIDATDPFGGHRLLPAGRLREPVTALSRADLIVITRSSHAPAVKTMIGRYTNAPVFYAHMEFRRIETFMAPPTMSEHANAEPKYFAFSGLGNPQGFFDDIRAWGLEVRGQRAFPDHHKYSKHDLDEVVRAAQRTGADALICTEKDMHNLQPPALQSLQVMPIHACVASLNVMGRDRFVSAIYEIIQSREERVG